MTRINSLKDKVVLVTGASSGFGEDAARLFARKGCRVVLTARRWDRLNHLAEEIRSFGGKTLVAALDIRDQEQIQAVVELSRTEFGSVDILFNNAGFGRLNWLETLSPVEDINAQIDINLRGLIQMTRALLPGMLEQRSGIIINMSSIAGKLAPPLYSIYSATKFGVRGFTESLRREVKPFGIQVCGIYPGGAVTEFGQHSGNSSMKSAIKVPSSFRMSSTYVAAKVVSLAERPRRELVIPFWMAPVIWLGNSMPGLMDQVVAGMVKKYHNY